MTRFAGLLLLVSILVLFGCGQQASAMQSASQKSASPTQTRPPIRHPRMTATITGTPVAGVTTIIIGLRCITKSKKR